MRFYLLFLLSLTLFGVHAKPVDQSITDHRSPMELRTEDEASAALQDLTVQNPEGSTTTKPGFLAWLLTPLAQTLQINPQTLLQNGVTQLKETLNNLGLKTRDDVKAKQLKNAIAPGINDPGFDTNRLEAAGFFDGNGWLANEGRILADPGAILSDYPTSYGRK